MDIHIEEYVETDKDTVLKGLIELQNFEVPLSDTRARGTRDNAAEYLEILTKNVREKGGAFLCAHIDNELVGFVVCWVEKHPTPNETADSTTYGYISDAFVFEKYRGQGVFKELNQAAETHLSAFPEIKRVRINVLAQNAQALGAYRSAGYSDYEIMLEKKVK